ncbi:MAG: putative lipid II flippase FtsW [Acidimicrobiia bacterium]|nr:putative lipid II flippase FtsW [Acidimicrobiia bacterium]
MSTRIAKVTSITARRAAERKRSEQSVANARAATTLFAVVAALLVIGVTATISASSAVAIDQQSDGFYFFKRQLVGIGLGVIAMAVASRVPYHTYRKLAVPIFLFTVGLLLATLIFGTGAGGAQRWIAVGPITIQASEIAKFAVVVVLAAVLDKKRKLLTDLGHFAAPVVAVMGVTGLLVMLQPDLGTTIVIAAAALAVILTSATPVRFVLYTGLSGAFLATVLAFSADYRLDRITGFRDPWADVEGTGWQLIQSWYALGSGGMTGVGLGASRARWFYLPNAHTDFIYAIIGEETGFVGGLLVMLLFVLLGAAGWAIAARAVDPFGRMVAAGITVWLSFQAIVNIGGVVGLLPITGITLPFVSYGSTAVAVSMGAVGVLANIAYSGGRRRRS